MVNPRRLTDLVHRARVLRKQARGSLTCIFMSEIHNLSYNFNTLETYYEIENQ